MQGGREREREELEKDEERGVRKRWWVRFKEKIGEIYRDILTDGRTNTGGTKSCVQVYAMFDNIQVTSRTFLHLAMLLWGLIYRPKTLS